ncbi:hypothetical protein [Streptomyces cinerochromogenes]|uniref:hypothetical protein n=1 Tax=Streptomyces cinerochromogenes TaxID=66422 RepID=UPI00166FA33E|nr:hypothetical protein [Streptomyces cinerochromogenes]
MGTVSPIGAIFPLYEPGGHMKRAGLLSAGALAALLGAVACSASSPQDTYWDGYAQGEITDTALDPDPDYGKGIDPKDVAEYINACAS